MKLLGKYFLFVIISFWFQNTSGQSNSISIYYIPVEMPASLKTNYYGQFDTRLLAEDLAALLQQATKQPFVAMPYQKGEIKGIFLLLDSTKTYNSNEHGILESDGKSFIRISAKYTTGISYAMYSWLEELGFHFYLPGSEWTMVPSLNTVFNKKVTRKNYKPYFRLRMFSASGGIFPVKGLDEDSQNEKDWQQWYRRNRMGCDYISIDGHKGELFNIVHKKEIENDPSILAPVDGKRVYSVGAKLDPTNKKGVALFSNWIVEEATKNAVQMPSFLPFKKYYSSDPGDGLNYCHTAECEREFKSVSDQVFSIANETARKIKQQDTRWGVSLLAYTEHGDTPSIRMEPNVHVMVVPAAFQSVTTPTNLLQRWAKKTKNISEYDFINIGVWAYDAPFFNLYEYHYNLKFLQSLGIEGISFETSLSKFASGIQQYLILKFLCDPYQSVDKLLDEFCNNNFGKASVPIKKLLKEWYCSNTHLNTGYEKNSFQGDELGRFIQYIIDAENSPGISPAIKKRIEELKAYVVYLCKFYEMFSDMQHTELFKSNNALRSDKAEALLTYTWQMYHSKIFHNTQLNDLLKKFVAEEKRATWDFRNSDHFKSISTKASQSIITEFESVKNKYLPMATAPYYLADDFMTANAKYSADSIRITTIDETSFGSYSYPLKFYAAAPGSLKINYQAGTAQIKNSKKDKIAIISVEKEDYSFIKNNLLYNENSAGTIIYRIPAKGYYKLYLSQYDATHVNYVIYPGKNLFYIDKRMILSNAMQLQDNAEKNNYSNKWLAFIATGDSIYFQNFCKECKNSIRLYTEAGKNIPVNSSRQPYINSAAVPLNRKTSFIFFDNNVFRWPALFKNSPPYYFFLKYPIK